MISKERVRLAFAHKEVDRVPILELTMRAQTEKVIRISASGGGFILSTSSSVHPGVKPKYYPAMLDTARQVGFT